MAQKAAIVEISPTGSLYRNWASAVTPDTNAIALIPPSIFYDRFGAARNEIGRYWFTTRPHHFDPSYKERLLAERVSSSFLAPQVTGFTLYMIVLSNG